MALILQVLTIGTALAIGLSLPQRYERRASRKRDNELLRRRYCR